MDVPVPLKDDHNRGHLDFLDGLRGIKGTHDLLAHIALVHNLSPAWSQSIQWPLWSIATEWQIYFLFALILLPILRWWGTLVALIASLLLWLIPSYLLRSHHSLDLAFPWLVVLFTIGMIGAHIVRKHEDTAQPWRKKLLLHVAIPCIALVPVFGTISMVARSTQWMFDLAFGLLTIWLILAAYHQTRAAFWTPRRLLELRPVVQLGCFSYSLYLTHILVLIAVRNITHSHLAPTSQACLNLVVGTPLAIVCAWAFYRVFENPFLNKPVASP